MAKLERKQDTHEVTEPTYLSWSRSVGASLKIAVPRYVSTIHPGKNGKVLDTPQIQNLEA